MDKIPPTTHNWGGDDHLNIPYKQACDISGKMISLIEEMKGKVTDYYSLRPLLADLQKMFDDLKKLPLEGILPFKDPDFISGKWIEILLKELTNELDNYMALSSLVPKRLDELKEAVTVFVQNLKWS